MDKIVKKYSAEMDGLEFLFNSGSARSDRANFLTKDDDGDSSSTTSSRISEPFSEYASLDEYSTEKSQDIFHKFSSCFQSTMKELENDKISEQKILQKDEKKTNIGNLVSAIKSQIAAESVEPLNIKIPEILNINTTDSSLPEPSSAVTRRLSSSIKHELMPTDSTPITNNLQKHGSFWEVLEQYNDFKLSICGGPENIIQTPITSSKKEAALVKCAEWIEKQGETTLFEREKTPPPIAHKKIIKEQKIPLSKWKREKTILLACKMSTEN